MEAMRWSPAALFLVCAGLSAATAQSTPGDAYRLIGEVSGRLQIPPLDQPLKLEAPNEIPILLHGYKVHDASATLTFHDDQNRVTSQNFSEVVVSYRPDDSAYVTVIPERVGKMRLLISVDFEDRNSETHEVETEVTFPARKPDTIYVSRAGSGDGISETIKLDPTERSRHARLVPMALYGKSAHAVPIPARDVHFNLISATASEPPISIDQSTGTITALRIGHALVLTTFEGLSTLTCINVLQTVGDGSDRTECRELVPRGMTPPPTGLENMGSPPSVMPSPKSRD